MSENNWATIRRVFSGDLGTFGVFEYRGVLLCSAELPWRDNKTNISCIPAGTYPIEKINWEKYRVKDVPGRTLINIEIGNWPEKESQGCIFLGDGFFYRGNHICGVSESTPALKRLNNFPSPSFLSII